MLVLQTEDCLSYEIFYAFPVDGGASWTAGSGALFDLSSDEIPGSAFEVVDTGKIITG